MENRSWFQQPEMIVGLSALLVSLVAVGVALYSAYIDRAYARASVWPRLEVGRAFNSDVYAYLVTNNGTGPAVVKWAALTLKDKPQTHWEQYMASIAGDKKLNADTIHYGQSHISTSVLPATKQIKVMSSDKPELIALLHKASSETELKLCYCSIYDECWITSWKQPLPLAVDECITPQQAFSQ